MVYPDKELLKKDIFDERPELSFPALWRYLITRIPTLFDIPMLHSEEKWYQVFNPLPGLREMTGSDWNFYFLGFFAWTIDAMDFFCVSATASAIANTLDVSITKITWGVTLVLMLRSVGSLIFGLLSDVYGRKWPYIIICALFIVVEIGTGFVQNYRQFLACRAIFGILMGSMYPVASTTALENQPVKARSILSGLFLPGYNLGYIFAVIFYRAFEFSYKGDQGWRALFWFSAGLPIILIAWRLCYPESEVFLNLQKSRALIHKLDDEEAKKRTRIHFALWTTIKTEWVMFIYLIFLMSGFNFISHGSQDLYPTLLTKQREFDADRRTVILVIVNIGAICGGIFFGQLTELLGRRLTIIICMIWSGAFLYPSFFSSNPSTIIGGYFFLNFGVMGSWGVAPIHLIELVNTSHRALLSGFVYQLGNLASSASSTIEAELGTRFPIKLSNNANGYDYGKVMCIFCGAVFAYMVVVIVFGPERFHKDLAVHFQSVLEEEEYESLEFKSSVEHKD